MGKNVIKSGFVAFAQDEALLIDSENYFKTHDLIKSVDEKDEDIEGLELSDILSDEKYADPEFEEKKQYADFVIKQAEDKAGSVIAEANIQASQIMADAKEQGFKQGYEEGKAKADAELKETLEKERADMEAFKESFIAETEAAKEAYLESLEPQAAELICQYVTMLTGVITSEQESVMLYMINKAMRDIEDCKEYNIKVSTEDYGDLFEKRDEIYGVANPALRIELFADAKLARNQCIIETDNGIIDVSLDTQLKNLIRDIKIISGLEKE